MKGGKPLLDDASGKRTISCRFRKEAGNAGSQDTGPCAFGCHLVVTATLRRRLVANRAIR